MKLKLFGLSVFAVAALAVLTFSCSREEKLLDAIPSDVKQAGTVRLKSVLEQCGCKFTGTGIERPEGLEFPLRFDRIVAFAGSLDSAKVCDINSVAWAMDDKGDALATILISGREEFVEALSGRVDWTGEEGGYTIGSWCGMTVVADDERAWLTDAPEAVGAVGAFVKRADRSAISSLSGVSDMLSGDGLMNIVLRQDAFGKKSVDPMDSQWATMKMNVAENKLVCNSVVMTGDGSVTPLKGMCPINPAILGYVPADFNMAFGFGVTRDFDWRVITDAVSVLGGFQARGMMAAAFPYLEAVDGTIFFAAGPANDNAYSDFEPGNWRFMLMAHLPQDKINDIMGMARTSLFMAGVSPRNVGDNMMIIPQYGMDIYIGNVDGYLAIGNIAFESTHNNALAPLFTGKEAAAYVELPSLRSIVPTAPAFGFRLTGESGEGRTQVELGLTGDSRPIVRAIFEALL